MKFKIGDKVKIIKGVNRGLTGVIATTDRTKTYSGANYDYGINLDQKAKVTYGNGEKWSSGDSDLANEEDMELIEHAKPLSAREKLKALLNL